MNIKKRIVLSKPRGFCAGVIRAEKTIRNVITLYKNTQIYVRKQIVHNKYIIDELTEEGIQFVNEIDEIPDNSIVIYSAHGVSPYVRKKANEKSLKQIDATCPFVEKVHNYAIKYAMKDYHIIFIGHKNHEEAEGTTGEALLVQQKLKDQNEKAGNTYIISSKSDSEILQINYNKKIACLTQTTLNINDTREIAETLKQKFRDRIIFPDSENICYATKNRQDALKNMINQTHCKLVLIIGSQNSSNSKRLVETAIKCSVKGELIDTYKDIKDEWLEDVDTIGISSGASAPEILIDEIIIYLKQKFDVEVEEIIYKKEEKICFSLPKLDF